MSTPVNPYPQKSEDVRTGKEWASYFGMYNLNPSAWKDFRLYVSEKITHAEFKRLVAESNRMNKEKQLYYKENPDERI